MKYLPPVVALSLSAACLLGAAYAYYLASQKARTRDKALPVGVGILLTVMGLLFPVLGYSDVVLRKLRKRRGKFFKAAGNNGLTVPQATLFS
jgi:hypothetical protein